MAEHTITISDSTYQSLLEEVQAKDMTVDSWIAAKLSRPDDDAVNKLGYYTATITTQVEEKEEQPGFEFPEDLIGSIDSTGESTHKPEKTAFGEILKAKFEKQGIHLP